MNKPIVTAVLLVALAASGCGSGKASARQTTSPADTTRTSSNPTVALALSVRTTLRNNYQLSSYVLWHNTVPASAQQSTRGPALAGLRSAAAARRKQGIRIRAVSGHLTIVSVTLDPSFTSATATTIAAGRVRPYTNRKPLGRSIAVHERAHVELRRLGRSQRFIVWQVTLLR